MIDPELDEPITDLGLRPFAGGDAGRGRQGAPAAADVVLLAELRLPDGLGRQGRAEQLDLDARGGGRARRPPRLADHQRRPGRRRRATAAPSGTRRRTDLDELRETFRRKAHTAAMERCLTALLRADRDRSESTLGDGHARRPARRRRHRALLQRRAALGSAHGRRRARHGRRTRAAGYPPDDVPLALRRARSTRISIDGNAHFCRGLLRTRYGPGERGRRQAPRAGRPSFPCTALTQLRRTGTMSHHASRPGRRLPQEPAR